MAEKGPNTLEGDRKRAEALANDPVKVAALLTKAQEKAQRDEKRLGAVWGHLQALFRLLTAWRRKQYTVTPWKTIAWSVFALIYFVDPIDLIPDFIPVIGYLDDITVIGFVMNSVRKDIDRFLEWERANAAG